MNFVKRKGTTSKSKATIIDFEGKKKEYLAQIKACIEMESILDELVIHWDQIGLQIVPFPPWTMEREGAKRVEINGIESKALIAGVFAGTLNGTICPYNLTTREKLEGATLYSTFQMTGTSLIQKIIGQML